MSCPHGVDRELVSCAQCEREERRRHIQRVLAHQAQCAAELKSLQADFDCGARAFFDFLRRADVERAAQPNLTGDSHARVHRR